MITSSLTDSVTVSLHATGREARRARHRDECAAKEHAAIVTWPVTPPDLMSHTLPICAEFALVGPRIDLLRDRYRLLEMMNENTRELMV